MEHLPSKEENKCKISLELYIRSEYSLSDECLFYRFTAIETEAKKMFGAKPTGFGTAFGASSGEYL